MSGYTPPVINVQAERIAHVTLDKGIETRMLELLKPKGT
jgi:hypothetical protein